MSLILNLAEYLEDVSALTIDTDLFVGEDILTAPPGSVIIREMPGSTENWSEMEDRVIQILVGDLSYIAAETLAETVYNHFANKPGFNNAHLATENIFFMAVVNRPAPLLRDERGNYIFAMTFLLRRT